MNEPRVATELLELRRRAHSGRFIAQHRAFLRVDNRWTVSWSAVLLVVGLTGAVLAMLPLLARFWEALLQFAAPAVGLEQIAVAPRIVLPFLRVQVPYVQDVAPAPTQATLGLAAGGSLVVLIASLLLPSKYLPLTYLMRVCVIIQLVAVLYFLLFAERFPYTLAHYSSDMYTVGLAIVAVVPMLLSLTYFVFDFGPVRKLLLVGVTLAHLGVFIPLQYLLHAAVVKLLGLVFLPALFMVGGVLLDVSVIIALYGWGMSWRDRTERIMGPATVPLPPRSPTAPTP